ncbi:MAG: glycosyltransferase [Candidatus Hydrogenedentota bacterium]
MAEVLTIIIPTFNHCELLGECLTSLETQSGAAIKVLLVMKNFLLMLLLKHFFAIKFELVHQTGRVISTARAEFGLLKALGVWQKAMWEWTFLMPYVFVQRWGIQRSRTISVDELDRMLTR